MPEIAAVRCKACGAVWLKDGAWDSWSLKDLPTVDSCPSCRKNLTEKTDSARGGEKE